MIDVKILRCVKCKVDNSLKLIQNGDLQCNLCGELFEVVKQRPIMIDKFSTDYLSLVKAASSLNDRNSCVRNNPWNKNLDIKNYFFKHLFSNCNRFDLQWKFLAEMIEEMVISIHKNSFSKPMILDIGAGDAKYGSFFADMNYTSTDLVYSSERHKFDFIDLVSNAENLPIANSCADFILNFALMEHVPNPEKVISEIARVLKNGGKVYSIIPLTRPEHMQPYDFYRFTRFSIDKLFKDSGLEIINIQGSNKSLWTPVHYLHIICLTFPFRFYKSRFLAIMINRILNIFIFPLLIIARKLDKYFPDEFPIYYWVEGKKI
jgi:SAM-dependent methyltransferase